MVGVLVAHAARLLYYSAMTAPWQVRLPRTGSVHCTAPAPYTAVHCTGSVHFTAHQVLPIELMQGVTFGLFYPCLVSEAARVAPPGMHCTALHCTE
jgi:hypothetical protein